MPDPDRGLIERDAQGEPNGIIRERNDLYTRLVPRDKPADVRGSLLENVRDQLKLGITSVIEAGASVDPALVGSYAEWELLYQKHGENLARAAIQIGYPYAAGHAQEGAARLKDFGKKTGDGNDRLRVGSDRRDGCRRRFYRADRVVAGGLQGSAGLPRARFLHAGGNPSQYRGGPSTGWQFGIHAIGDAAIAMTVDCAGSGVNEVPAQ